MADPNVAVAATFVASVMEQAGYLTQARFLEEFQSFFRDAGALIYTLAGAGAVVAMTMYGSTRAVQYFLIGPALFWFLVGPTSKSEGVRWKLGGGEYLGMFREQGKAASDDFEKKVLEKVRENGKNGNGGDIKVATGFWLFAWPINEFVNEFVDVILDKESTEDLTAQTKIQGLELIGSMLPYDADHIQHLEEFATQCNQYFGAANSAAEIRARIRAKEAATRGGGTVQGDTTTEAFNTFKARMNEYGKSQTIDPENSGILDLLRWMSQAQASEAKGQQAITLAQKLLPKAEQGLHIECQDVWTLIAAETWFKAKEEIPKILRTSSGYWKYQASKEFTCEELTRKTLNDETAECNLTPSVAMFTLYNHWKSQDTYQRLIGRHRNGKDFTNPKATTIVTGPMARGFQAVTLTGQDGSIQSVRRQSFNEYGQPYIEQYMYNPDDVSKPGFDDKVRYQWMPIAPITELRGMDHAMNVASRQFDTTRLKQQLISYAMQLPYYQGVALYMVAIAYPFLALIVLLPGRAQNFLAVPLAWLWLKSWDIGFAVVIVLDKIMYNLLPNWALDAKLRDGPWTSSDELIEVMAQGFNFDPWGSIHNYYAIMAMATLSIPALTGAATLKAKKGVLSSFSDAAAAQAKNRADKAASGFSVQAQSERNHMMMQVKGLALLMAHGGDGDVSQGARGKIAGFNAAMQTALETLKKEDLKSLAQGDLSVLSKLPENASNAATTYLQHYGHNIGAYAPFASQLNARWDRNIGRAGVIQHMEEAYAAAMDSGGVYEMSGIGESPIEQMLGLMASQADARIRAGGKAMDIGGKSVGDFADSPIAASVVAAAAVYAGDEFKGQVTLEGLKKLAGAEGMTNEEFLRAQFFMDRFTYETPMLQAELGKLKEGISDNLVRDERTGEWRLADGASFKEPTTGALMLGVYNVLSGTDGNSRGGPSSLVDLDLDTMSPGRSLAALPQNDAQAQANLQIAVPMVDESTLNRGISAIEQKFGELVGNQQQGQYSPVEIQAAEGLQMFISTMARREDDINQRLASNQFVGGVVPNYAQDQMNRIQSEIMSLVGGGQEVVSYWNSHGAGNGPIGGRRLELTDGVLKFSDGKEFTGKDLVHFVEEKSRDPETKKEYSERITKAYAADGVIDVYDKLQIEAMGVYQELPQFKYQGQDKNIGLAQLMEVDPLTTLQVAKEWAAHHAGVFKGDSFGMAPASAVMTKPSQYFED